MWGWRRTAVSTPAPQRARLPIVRGEWRSLPPIQRAVPEHPLVNPVSRFSASLASWRDPSFLAPLGHRVGAAEPTGVVGGLAVARTPVAAMPVVMRSRAGQPGRRSISSWLTGAVAQRAAGNPDEPMPAAPAVPEQPAESGDPEQPAAPGEPESTEAAPMPADIGPVPSTPLWPFPGKATLTSADTITLPTLRLQRALTEPGGSRERPAPQSAAEPSGSDEPRAPEPLVSTPDEPAAPYLDELAAPYVDDPAGPSTIVTAAPVASMPTDPAPATPAAPVTPMPPGPAPAIPAAPVVQRAARAELPMPRRPGLGAPIDPPRPVGRPMTSLPMDPPAVQAPPGLAPDAAEGDGPTIEQAMPDAPLAGATPPDAPQAAGAPDGPREPAAVPDGPALVVARSVDRAGPVGPTALADRAFRDEAPRAPYRDERPVVVSRLVGDRDPPSTPVPGALPTRRAGTLVQRADTEPGRTRAAQPVPAVPDRTSGPAHASGSDGTAVTVEPESVSGGVPADDPATVSALIGARPPIAVPAVTVSRIPGLPVRPEAPNGNGNGPAKTTSAASPVSVARAVTAVSPHPAILRSETPAATVPGVTPSFPLTPWSGDLPVASTEPVNGTGWAVAHAGPVLVQRQEPAGAPPPAQADQPVAPAPPESAAAAAPQTAAPASGAAPAGAPAAQTEPDELVKKLFDPLLRKLKTELRLDRERRGVLTDRWH